MSFMQSSVLKYIIRRLIYMIPVLLGVSIITFVTMHAAGDPVNIIKSLNPRIDPISLQGLISYYGLDKPLPVQYLNWLANLLRLNFGESITQHAPVNAIIGDWFLWTVELQVISVGLSLALSIPIGINAAKKPYSKSDVSVTSFSILGVSMPTYWLGIILIIVFSYELGWLPFGGAYGDVVIWGGNRIIDHIAHLVLPVIVLVYVTLAQNVRLIRANMLEALRSDYVLAARASGISENKITYRYALRNAISPVITFLGITLGAVIGGAPMTEYVFSWPGLGREFVAATSRMDFPVIMAITIIITAMTLLANLAVDIAYVVVDPRVRLE